MNKNRFYNWLSAHMARHRATAALAVAAITGWVLAIWLVGLMLTMVAVLAGVALFGMGIAAASIAARRAVRWWRKPAAASPGLQENPREITLRATIVPARHA